MAQQDTPEVVWPALLSRLLDGEALSEAEAGSAMRAIMSGAAGPAQTAGFLVALRAKGETVEEITGLARTMREFSLRVAAAVDGPLLDTCGTGGDRAGTVNLSTMAALVCAGAGARVAKHGNRAASSRCGSADLLEALGVVIDLDPAGVAVCIEEAGIGFCFAPRFHPAMKHVAPVRRELAIPTVFNFLGPLTNPAGATRQTVGVSDPFMAPKMAEALRRLGSERALVFRGDDGLDELTVTTTSRVWEVDGSVRVRDLDPREYGISLAAPAALAGQGPGENAEICRAVLGGEPGPVRDAVVLNAAAGLVAAGLADDYPDGVTAAAAAIDSGDAAKALEGLRDVSQRVQAA